MRIAAVYTRGVRALSSESTLRQAAEEMTRESVGALGVLEDGKIAGIISERDIVRAVTEGLDPSATLVSQFTSRGVHAAQLTDDSTEVALRMLEHGVRHLPVVSDGDVVGIISARDLLMVEAVAPASQAG